MAHGFDEWLTEMLKRRDVSQKDFADRVGVTPAAVNAWTKGRSEPRYEKIEAVAAALGVPVEDAIGRRQPAADRSELAWMFQRAPEDGSRNGGNPAAYAFAANLNVLAREATQNSLDERFLDDQPVEVHFALEELTGRQLDSFKSALRWDTIEAHLRTAAQPGQKAGRVLLDGLQDLQRTGRLTLLRIDDYNASGLTGPDYDDGRFARVVRRTLDSHKAGGQGGSYGLGKAALWAASRFGLVLVNSTLSEPREGRAEGRMAGRLDLPWHELGDAEFAGPAWFGEPDPDRANTARSWWSDPETVESLRLTRAGEAPGTSFLIVGAYDGSGRAENLQEMDEHLRRGVATNFWGSMVGGSKAGPMLRAYVGARRDGLTVIPETEIDPHEYEPVRSRAVKAFLDGHTVDTLTSPDDVVQRAVPLTVPPLKMDLPGSERDEGRHDAVLLVTPTQDDDAKPDCITFMRASRMSVRNRRVGDLPLGHRRFQAILLAGLSSGLSDVPAARAEQFLRAAEPPEHDDWTSTEDLTATYVRGARQSLLNFKKAADQAVREILSAPEEETDEDEGPPALRELLTLNAPKKPRTAGFPTVHAVDGDVSEAGAWRVRVTVKLPERETPWVLAPVARFVVRSGANIAVRWAGTLVPERDCELTRDGSLRFRKGARRGVFRGVTDVASHPLRAQMSCLEVDLPRAREEDR